MKRGRAALWLLGAVWLLAMLGGGAWIGISQMDLAGLAASRASAALGRPVQVGALRVTPGLWLRIEAAGLQVANVPGGTRPAMVEVRRMTAEVSAFSLLYGPLTVRRLEAEGVQVLLERGAGGVRNWRLGPPRPDAPAGPLRAAGQPGFPLLRDVRLRGGEVMFRTSRGTLLRVRLDEAVIAMEGADAPVRLQASGAYQGVPLTLRGDLDPIGALRRPAPYGAKLRFEAANGRLDFAGTMLDPLGLDGVAGVLTLDTSAAGPLLRMAGVAGGADLQLRLAGQLDHAGGNWSLTGGTGALDGSEVQAASLRLTEGIAGKPDQVQADLAFVRLDLNELLGSGPRGRRGGADIPLQVDPAPDTLVDLHLTAKALRYGDAEFEDAALTGALEPGRVVLHELALTYLGARVQASGRIVGAASGGAGGGVGSGAARVARRGAAGQGGGVAGGAAGGMAGAAQVSAELLVGGADVQRFRQALGFGDMPVQGRLSAQVEASASGRTLNAALRSARVSAVVALTEGSITREAAGMASADVRLLLREASGTVPVECLLAALDMRGGVGTLSPLRLRSAEGTVAGHGRFDLNRRVLDLTIGSERDTAATTALDIPPLDTLLLDNPRLDNPRLDNPRLDNPRRISGPFARLDVRPAGLPGAGRATLAAMDAVAQLPPGLQAVTRRNGCGRQAGP